MPHQPSSPWRPSAWSMTATLLWGEANLISLPAIDLKRMRPLRPGSASRSSVDGRRGRRIDRRRSCGSIDHGRLDGRLAAPGESAVDVRRDLGIGPESLRQLGIVRVVVRLVVGAAVAVLVKREIEAAGF